LIKLPVIEEIHLLGIETTRTIIGHKRGDRILLYPNYEEIKA